MTTDTDLRYFTDLAAAFVRGRRPDLVVDGLETRRARNADIVAAGVAAGLRLHKFKRNTELPRVRRVLGALRGIAPATLLDVGSGRGTFLWPVLDAFPDMPVTAIDVDARRAADLDCVARGGVARLTAKHMDAEAMTFASRTFDVVTLLEVLEHMPHPERALAHAVRVAQRFVVVSVPSEEDDNPEHIHLFDAPALTRMFEAAGARHVNIDYVRGHIVAIGVV